MLPVKGCEHIYLLEGEEAALSSSSLADSLRRHVLGGECSHCSGCSSVASFSPYSRETQHPTLLPVQRQSPYCGSSWGA